MAVMRDASALSSTNKTFADTSKAKYYGASTPRIVTSKGDVVEASNTNKGYVYGNIYGNSNNNSTPATSSGGGGGGGGSTSYSAPVNNYYNDFLAAFSEQSAAARDEAIRAIMKNLDTVKGTYNNQIADVSDQYDRLVNENEVKKDRARRIIRENQANRGQLDSGLGRQELLNMNIGYDNITSNLNAARRKAINDIYNRITQAEAEAETNKANVRNNYANSMLQFRLANQ